MSQGMLDKIEVAYLKIFKIIVIIILTVALFISLYTLIKGTGEMFATPKDPSPPKTAPAPSISIDKFIEQIEPKKEAPQTPLEQNQEQPIKKEVKTNPDKQLDDMTTAYVNKLFTYLEGFQKSCGVKDPVDKTSFDKNFPKHIVKQWFKDFGVTFADSQDAFEKGVLSNQKVIKICKDAEGKGGIFYKSLDWHKDVWIAQLNEGRKFESKEEARYEREKAQEIARADMKRAQAMATLYMSLVSFGVFISLALLLIFSKIETNLRDTRVVRD